MTATPEGRSGATPARRLVDIRGDAGPTFVAVGAIHGNEPSGVDAILQLQHALESRREHLRGRFIAVTGNRTAYAAGERFITRDLNRNWTDQHLASLREREPSELAGEDREQVELLTELLAIEAESDGPLYVFDMHSTSGEGAPFVCMADTLRNRQIAFAIPAPVILGLEETIDGSMLGWLSDRGHVTVAFEGGQHLAPRTIEHQVAALWLALVASDLIDEADADDLPRRRRRLEEAARDLPAVVEIRHRHVVAPEDRYEMCDGFRNFQRILSGQLLARDRRGEILAPESGRILMPLYQSQGEDGYFLVRDVHPLWLKVSEILRRRGLDWIVPLLPGVRPHPELPDHFEVDPKVARFWAQEIFHLFGYRRRRPLNGQLVFSRRSPDTVATRRNR